jgi:hypothetical protein
MFMSRRTVLGILVGLLLAAAIHADWHLARPEHHRLSLGLRWHWLLAAPVFSLVAWYVARAWPSRLVEASVWILVGAVVVAGVVEPAWEYFMGGASLDWAFGAARTVALVAFVLTGVVSYVVTLALLRRGEADRTM